MTGIKVPNVEFEDIIKDNFLNEYLSSKEPSQILAIAKDLTKYAQSMMNDEKKRKIENIARIIYDYVLSFDEELPVVIINSGTGTYKFDGKIKKAQIKTYGGVLTLELYAK